MVAVDSIDTGHLVVGGVGTGGTTGLTVDAAGDLFIGDRENQRVRKVSANGIMSTLAGDGDTDFSGDGGPATKASLYWPLTTAVDRAGNVYIADDNHNADARSVRPGCARSRRTGRSPRSSAMANRRPPETEVRPRRPR